MEEKLKVGDVVRLRSGGPKLTVQKTFGDVVAVCGFVDGKVFKDEFVPGALVKVSHV